MNMRYICPYGAILFVVDVLMVDIGLCVLTLLEAYWLWLRGAAQASRIHRKTPRWYAHTVVLLLIGNYRRHYAMLVALLLASVGHVLRQGALLSIHAKINLLRNL